MKNKKPGHGGIPRWIISGVIPGAIYFVVFVAVTWPLILQFSTHFYTDERDGLGMIWNVWWVNKAVTQLHQTPWYTHYLFFPDGVSLFPHTLTPFNGFLAIVLLPFFSLIQTYNFLVVFSFVVAGLTMYWLSYYITRAYWPSIIAGFIFSFSNYHFAHTPGHLNLASLQWIPLFVLCVYVFLKKPGVRIALGAALCLFAVILCDYYYFFYCVMVLVSMFLWHAIRQKKALFFAVRPYRLPSLIFLGASLVSSGAVVLGLLVRVTGEEYAAGHDASIFSADLLSPFVYGSLLRFSSLTQSFWSTLPGNAAESSVYMGVSVVILIIFTWTQRRRISGSGLYLWFILLVFFLVNSLGPILHVAGKYVPYLPMPYTALERVFPILKMSGCPGRMMVVVMLCAALICAFGLSLLFQRSRKTRIVAGCLIVVLFIEFLPYTIKPFRAQVPEYVMMLRDLPGDGAVIDLQSSPEFATYYSTVYDRPLFTGEIARLSRRAADKKQQILETARRGDIDALHQVYGFRYAVLEGYILYDLLEKKESRTKPVFYKPYR